jgi:UDP-3-O-[3-hydroxymyristoyl] glucosamine N-acyltransferase
MKITAAQLAQLLQGEVEGNPEATIVRPARIEEAREGDFAFLDNPKYEHFAYSTRASVLLVHTSFRPSQPVRATLVRVDDVRSSLAFLLEKFQHVNGAANGNGPQLVSEQASVHGTARLGAGTRVGAFAVIEAGAAIGDNCVIYPQVYIGANARIGNGTVVHAGVRVQHDCEIGENCILHPNAVIGSDGFGFAPQEDRSWKRVPHVGNVVLEDDVEVGACTCIDRGSLGSTIIRRGAKLDNLVHIAHNVEVGAHTAIAAQVGIAGSTQIGNFCQLGGQAGFAGHLKLAEGTLVQAQSGVGMNTTEPNTALFGSPAFGFRDFMRSHWVFKQLPELHRKVRELEKMINK